MIPLWGDSIRIPEIAESRRLRHRISEVLMLRWKTVLVCVALAAVALLNGKLGAPINWGW
jgi:hypothetical protein